MTSLYDFSAVSLSGEEVDLAQYQGKVVLVVNTASKCGLTPQYEGLEALYREHKEDGLVILGFPCDQFAGQEFAEESEISEFCSVNYGVSFPMFSKVKVNGKDTHPLFVWLKDASAGVLGSAVKWNFTKFLVNREGDFVARFAPKTAPESFADQVRALL